MWRAYNYNSTLNLKAQTIEQVEPKWKWSFKVYVDSMWILLRLYGGRLED